MVFIPEDLDLAARQRKAEAAVIAAALACYRASPSHIPAALLGACSDLDTILQARQALSERLKQAERNAAFDRQVQRRADPRRPEAER